ncbi:MAG TPA: hypothetical protein PKE26_15735 [Kiritimatiellia bacterium]|mgnify:CR=1 FL=1|nr:hypothetical protein [Saprospiraceae bacterium]HMP00547.1 hypothetical protein [Kiritimatiellia bacterium]
MDKSLAEEIAVADFTELSQYAAFLRETITQSTQKQIQLILAAIAGLAAFLELRTGTTDLTLKEALVRVDTLVAAIFGSLTVLGIIAIANVARCRIHYVRVLRTLNGLRATYANVLGIQNEMASVWLNRQVKPWKYDSVSTWVIVGQIFAVAMTTIVATLALNFSLLICTLTTILVVVFSLALARLFSREQ